MKITTIFQGLFTLFLGGFLGAGVALLYAPQSGRATRAMLRNRGIIVQEKVADDLKITRAQMQKGLNSLASEAQARVNEVEDRIKLAQ